MAEEPGQTFPGGDISVATAELNPIMLDLAFLNPHDTYDLLTTPNIVVPPDVVGFGAHLKNDGDEPIDVQSVVVHDGMPTETQHPNIAVGDLRVIEEYSGNIPLAYLTTGVHTFNIDLYAKRTTEGHYPTNPQFTGTYTYYIYTSELNPVISKTELIFTDGTTHQLISEGAAIPNVIVPAGVPLTNPLAYCRNDGDEPLHVKWIYDDDNMLPVSCEHTNLLPGQEESCGIGAAEIYTSGEHTFSVTLYAARKGDPLPPTPSQTITGTFHAYTPELNPLISDVKFTIFNVDTDICKTPESVIPPDVDTFIATYINTGDEPIDIKCRLVVDGITQVNDRVDSGIAPGGSGIIEFLNAFDMEVLGCLTTGKHTIGIALWAKRPGLGWPAVPQETSSCAYYVYTTPLDAIATTVKIVQGTNEYIWLIDDGVGGFTVSTPTIAPGVATTFKFELSNPGDEPVKLNVGHYVVDHYETGFLIDSTLLDTVEKDVIVDAGATGVINTISFTPLANFTVDAFATLRTRHLV